MAPNFFKGKKKSSKDNTIPQAAVQSTAESSYTMAPQRDYLYMWDDATPLPAHTATQELWKGFHVTEYHFPSQNLPIPVLFIWHKSLDTERPKEGCPIHVHFFGGGFCTGSASNVDWYPPWKLRLMKDTQAITIAPNHRLMPEATGSEILADIDAFWLSYDRLLDMFLYDHGEIKANKDRLLISGTSSGGFLAMHSWLERAPNTLKAVFLVYPMLASYKREPSKFRGMDVSRETAQARFGECINRMEIWREKNRLTHRLGSTPPEGLHMAYMLPVVLYPNGVTAWQRCFREPDILERVDKLGPEHIPEHHAPIFIVHGKEDNAVPAANSQLLKSKLQKKVPGGVLNIKIWIKDYAPNDHGFDTEEGLVGGQPLEDQPNNTGFKTTIEECKDWWIKYDWNARRKK